ncbi:MAG: putative amino-acid ABC transporter-binding protein YhdW [Alphaproteobacteria bacterium MarineAlpha4_Bin2]|nr:MAG: putative amino-acid ABC transporter-binding protein YhdW [Alphaproteobacteria bacterium MarineAlpha4_Bin2]
MKRFVLSALGAVVAVAVTAGSVGAASTTLDTVKKRGQLICGVNTGLAGFSAPDDKGVWTGFDVDYCRAMSAAVFGNPDKVTYKPLTGKTRFPALQSGEIDILSRNTTWTFKRDVNLGFEFLGVTYYDGQGFIARKDLGVNSAKELDGASVCIQTGTTTELNLADFFRSNKMKFKSVVVEDAAEARQAYEAGRCDVYTTDRSGLAAQRSVVKDPNAHVILPEIISKEPLGPVVRHGDNVWGDIGRWVRNALVVAEELGISKANVDSMKGSNNPEIKRFLGKEGDFGAMLGLSKDWAYNVIKAVGNYGEIYERHIGPNTAIGLDRGVNNLWTNGGIIYAPPFR